MDHRVNIAGVTVDTRHFISNERVSSAETFAAHSAIDESLLGHVARGGLPEVNAAVAAAKAAFPAWAALGPHGRLPYLERLAHVIEARVEDLAAVETTNNGSLLEASRLRVMKRGAHNIHFFAELALSMNHGFDTEAAKNARNEVRYDPAGVTALITPWNAPFMLSTWKVGPALAAGNTVVLKPAEWTPFTASLLADFALEAGLPPGVFNVVQGIGGEAGAALVAHGDVKRISFTGSVPTAKKIASSAAQNLTPCSFELGGKSPYIVFADCDLDLAVKNAVEQYDNAGQVCLSGTRLPSPTPSKATLENRTPWSVRSSHARISSACRASWNARFPRGRSSSLAGASHRRSRSCTSSRRSSRTYQPTPKSSKPRSSDPC
jgi:aminomuconate-semialdehyde/2-hydroxymuconate-6-semialdehyde dehydrogenase